MSLGLAIIPLRRLLTLVTGDRKYRDYTMVPITQNAQSPCVATGLFLLNLATTIKYQLPDGFNNAATYATKLRVLREDRNLADYSHLASEADLVVSAEDAGVLVEKFLDDSREYLTARGITL